MIAPLSSNRAVLLVARREFIAQVRSRAFVVGLAVTLALLVGSFLIVSYIGSQSSGNTLGLTPQTMSLRPVLEATAQMQDAELEIRDVDADAGARQVSEDEIDALLTGGPNGYRIVGRDAVESELQTLVTTAVARQTLTTALAQAGVDPVDLEARSRVAVDTQEPVDPDRGQRLALAIVGTILLFVSFSGFGQLVATGVVEEKSSRVVELLLATIKPWQLLSGKILGLGAVGLLQLVILSGIGAGGAVLAGLLTVPSAAVGMFVMVILWYLLGFFLFAALYAAVGSTVSRQEELNSVITPVALLIFIPFVLTLNLLPSDPRNELAAVLSFIPFFSQTVMPARYALGVAPLWQVGVSALLALVAIGGVVRLAGRIYRNSVLRTGARVSLREALGSTSR